MSRYWFVLLKEFTRLKRSILRYNTEQRALHYHIIYNTSTIFIYLYLLIFKTQQFKVTDVYSVTHKTIYKNFTKCAL